MNTLVEFSKKYPDKIDEYLGFLDHRCSRRHYLQLNLSNPNTPISYILDKTENGYISWWAIANPHITTEFIIENIDSFISKIIFRHSRCVVNLSCFTYILFFFY